MFAHPPDKRPIIRLVLSSTSAVRKQVLLSYNDLKSFLIIIIIIGTTARFEPRPSFEAFASCPSSLQRSSIFSLPASCRLPSRPPPATLF